MKRLLFASIIAAAVLLCTAAAVTARPVAKNGNFVPLKSVPGMQVDRSVFDAITRNNGFGASAPAVLSMEIIFGVALLGSSVVLLSRRRVHHS